MSPVDPQVPPVGEEIHLPGPTLLPVVLTVGLTLTIIGVTLGPIFWAPGLVITVGSIARWIRDTQRDIDELPLEHHH